MKFQIRGKIYDGALVEDLSLKLLLKLEKETADFGQRLTVSDINRIGAEVNALKTGAERAAHPDILWITAVSIWAARVMAGDAVTFDQAVDFPISELTYLPDPEDHKKPANPTKARPGSGRAGKPRTAVRK